MSASQWFGVGASDLAEVETGESALSIWKICLVRAIVTMAIGAVALVFPLQALLAFTIVFAAFFFGQGLFDVLMALKKAWRGQKPWRSRFLTGLIGLALGGAVLSLPVLATFAYSLMALAALAGWSAFTGILEMRAGLKQRGENKGEWLLIASGALSILLGILIPIVLLLRPESFVFLAWVIGIYALFAGLTLFWKALSLRRAVKRTGE